MQAAKTSATGGGVSTATTLCCCSFLLPSVNAEARRSQSSKPLPAASVPTLQMCQVAYQAKKTFCQPVKHAADWSTDPDAFEKCTPTLRCYFTSDLPWPGLQTATASHKPKHKRHATISNKSAKRGLLLRAACVCASKSSVIGWPRSPTLATKQKWHQSVRNYA